MPGGFPAHWRSVTALSIALLPVGVLFAALSAARRALYRLGVLAAKRLRVPVVVIGNRVVGGTGKTPLVLALAEELRRAGYRPGIVSRGYGGERGGERQVLVSDSADLSGDEPLLLARRSGCPVWTGRDRVAAGRALLIAHPECDVLLCDDGLQHYRLARDIEIAVEDARGHGNGLPLPSGPLREPATRRVDALVVNGEPHAARRAALDREERWFRMELVSDGIYALDHPDVALNPEELRGRALHAVAGIGDPQRFFAQLQALGLQATPHAFPDHHRFQPDDLRFDDGGAVLMTEKDAVKCAQFRDRSMYALRVRARIDPAFFDFVRARLRGAPRGP